MENYSAPYSPKGIDHGYSLSALMIDITLIVVIVVSIFGNLLIICALAKDKVLRKPSNIFIGSLALADLLVATLVMPLSLSTHLVDHQVFMNPVFCSTHFAFDIMFCSTSVLHLFLISIDRYVAIKSPMVYRRRMNNTRATMASGVAWMICALKSMFPIYFYSFGNNQHDLGGNVTILTSTGADSTVNSTGPTDHYDSGHRMSFENSYGGWHLAVSVLCNIPYFPTYDIIISIVDFFLPCMLMSFLYSRIFLLVRQRTKSLRAGQMPLQSSKKKKKSCYSISSDNDSNIKLRLSCQQNASDRKALVILGSIMSLFIVCWCPLFAYLFACSAFLHCASFGVWVYDLFAWLGFFNSCLNPFVYAITNKDFRRAFKDILMFKYFRGI